MLVKNGNFGQKSKGESKLREKLKFWSNIEIMVKN